MKAVAPHTGLEEFLRQRKPLYELGIAAVEGGIEAGDLRGIRRTFHQHPDRRKVMGLVQRGEWDEVLEPVEHGVVHANRRGVFRAPVHDAVPHPVKTIACKHLAQEAAQVVKTAFVAQGSALSPGLFTDNGA